MGRRLLVLNPNTSPEVTEAYLAAARAVAPADEAFGGVTGRFGARIVSTEAENLIAGHAALELAAEHAADFDAVILAISFDTGLAALRSLLPMPVIGITEAALAAAKAQGRAIGIVFFGEVSRSLYEALVRGYGVTPVAMEAVRVESVADYLAPASQDDAALAACLRARDAGAEAIVICGAAIVGMAARLAERVEVPLHDGSAAVAASLAALAPGRSPPPVSPRPLAESVGLRPELAALLRGGRA